MKALNRHHEIFVQVIGRTAGLGVKIKSVGFIAAAVILAGSTLVWHDRTSGLTDIILTIAIAFVGQQLLLLWQKYVNCMVETLIFERADFTDLTQVTHRVVAMLPRVGFYKNYEAWRGNNMRKGLQHSEAYLALTTGQDVVIWQDGCTPQELTLAQMTDELWDSQDWTEEVKDGKLARDLQNPSDVFPMKADEDTASTVNMIDQRVFCEKPMKLGHNYKQFYKGGLSQIDTKWLLWYCIGGAVLMFLILGLGA